jgi:ATP adenylyltransferase
MERLWSPWRSQYITAFGTDKEYRGCVFCDAITAHDDDARYLVRRHRHCISLLNLYPYNSGHLLIIPHRHTATYEDLDDAAYQELAELLRRWQAVLGDVMHPHGFNIGTNVGRMAGAGIDQHIHFHIVPRWNGDSNFMPVLAETKVISESLHDTMTALRARYGERYGAPDADAG